VSTEPCHEPSVWGHLDPSCPLSSPGIRPAEFSPHPPQCTWHIISTPPAVRICNHCGAWDWLPWPRPRPHLMPAVPEEARRRKFLAAAGRLTGRRPAA
jgi:hypothetical protein